MKKLNLLISESQLEKLTKLIKEQTVKASLPNKENLTSSKPINRLFNLSDVKNPINSGEITLENPKETINNVYNMLRTNNEQLGLKHEDINLLFNATKKNYDVKGFLGVVNQTLNKYGISPKISFAKNDDGFEVKNVGVKFSIPNIKGGVGSIDVGKGKILAGIKFKF